jgi:uncharacterized protein YgiM (DUF1202 family)
MSIKATYFVANCRESITLRPGPSVDSGEITQIPLGQAVGFIEEAANGFYKINFDGQVGYALATYLSAERPAANPPSQTNNGCLGWVVKCNEWITLRSAPSTSADEVLRIPLGARLICYGDAGNGFIKVEYKGRYGYVLKEYVAFA